MSNHAKVLTKEIPRLNSHWMAWPFLIMLVVSLVTPSAKLHGVLQPKALSLALALLFTTLHAVSRKQWTRLQLISSLICMGLGLLVIFSFLLGSTTSVNNTFAEGIDEVFVFATTILAAGMIIYWHIDGGVPYATLLKTVLGANLVYNILKMCFIIAVLIGWLDLDTFLDLGYSVQTTTISGPLFRFQSGSDVPTPVLLLFALMSSRLKVPMSRSFKGIYIIVAVISIFFSYSRLQWVVGALAYPMWFFSNYSWKKVLTHAAGWTVIIMTVLAIVGIETPLEIANHRFFSGEVQQSDFTRQVQSDGLLTSFLQNPYLGSGIGGAPVTGVLARYSYHFEVQWLAFLMQFGILGLGGILLALATIAISYFKSPLNWAKMAFLSMYLLWLISGFTNPFLISLNSGILYGLFFVTALRLNSENTSAYAHPHRHLLLSTAK